MKYDLNTKFEHFSIAELCYSQTASRYGIANVPNQEQINNLANLAINVLGPLRLKFDEPIYVNSGFRSERLNKKVGGAVNSQHTKGEAVDISAKDRAKNKKIFELIRESGIAYDQLINENDYQWIHVSFKAKGNRKQVLQKVGKTYRIM